MSPPSNFFIHQSRPRSISPQLPHQAIRKMPPNQSTTQPATASAQQNQASAPNENSQRRLRRARGSQGFNYWVNAPIGSQPSITDEVLASSAPQRVAGRSSATQTAAGLEQHRTAFFDPAAREKRDRDGSMTTLYAMQLEDANQTIKTLCEKISRLLIGDQAKCNELKEKITELKFKNQPLKSKLKLMQMKYDMSSHHHFSSQPIQFGHQQFKG
ncbi:hypothetical protein PtB15_9B339 [Puccinia triticina]|nr:hypothetical protein PtB15_9B339 [Puccinia triticina]